MLSILVYSSQATSALSHHELERLVADAKAANAKADITGILLFDGLRFLQVLEGPADEVQGLFQRLRVDVRHRDVAIQLETTVSHRQFPGWEMRLLDITASSETRLPTAILDGVQTDVRDCIDAFLLDQEATTPELLNKATILLVDDSPEILLQLSRLLKQTYRIKAANGGAKALQLAVAAPRPDLVLLDSDLPDLSGEAVITALKADPATREIPVIFLTGRSDVTNEEHGLQLGAVDYISKPVNPMILLARVRAQLAVKTSADLIRSRARLLEQEVASRTRDLQDAQEVTILAMASLAEARDSETGNHIRRTQHYVKALAEHLRHHPRFAAVLTDRYIDLLFKSAPLHDIGKIGIPDHILRKQGRFTAEEFAVMKTHTTLGRDAIQNAENSLGKSVPFLAIAKEIAYSHQEKWDGSGYPCGLAGDAIPVSARLMAVADVYDAVISRRVYKDPFPHERAVGLIREGRGGHFDPDVTDAFLALAETFQAIAARYADPLEDSDPQPLDSCVA